MRDAGYIKVPSPQFVRATHPYAYKSGEWGQIIGERERNGRAVWLVVWPDGDTDEWATEDPDAGYEWLSK